MRITKTPNLENKLMFKTILVPLDGSEYSQTALDYAIRIGDKYNAHLQLLHVIDVRALEGPLLHDISASLGAAPLVNYQSQIRAILEERGRAILKSAEELVQESGLKYASNLTVGIVNKEIIDAATHVDLVTMGRHGEHASWSSVLLGSTLEAVVRKANRPILVTSDQVQTVSKILIAYNGDEHATQALHVAANMASEIDLEVIVLVVGDEEWATEKLEDAKTYLDPFQLTVTYLHEDGAPEKSIIAVADAQLCDIIVMGAYGENRIHELLLGSTTETVMRNTMIPILLVR